MRKVEKGGIFRSISAGTAVMLSSLAFAACGSEHDQGSKKISKCTNSHTAKTEPLDLPPSSFSLNLHEAVDELVLWIPRTRAGRALLDFSGYESIQEDRLIEAGKAVFHIDGEEFMVKNETKIDDPSEQVCASGGKFYPTNAAQLAINRMQEADIPVLHRR